MKVNHPSGEVSTSGAEATYTPHGRVAGKTQVGGGVSRTLTYGYHAAGQLATLTTPSGQQIGYAYLNGRAVSVTVNGTPLASGIVTTPFGPVGAWQWGNGRYTFRDYDGDGRLARWTFRNGTDLLRSDVSFDAASRITALADPLAPARSAAYQYDALDRLTLAQQGSPVTRTWQYGYDALGNRTAAQADAAVTTLAYAAGSQQLQQVAGGSVPGYLAGRTNVSFGYNNANRLATITGDGVLLASYAVNGLGQRVAKTVAGVTTHFVYDEQGRLIGEYDASGQLIQETVWLDDLPLATLRPIGTGNPTPIAIHYVHADHLGTPRAVTRPGDDQLLWRWDNAEPFGNSPPDENPSAVGTFSFHLRFPGQYFDAETGLHYNYFRDYDPTIGRYTQSDPIGIVADPSVFVYVRANPIANKDRLGLFAYHGNWCGPDWTGGHRREYGQIGPGDDVLPPVDALDRCCMVHDVCYWRCRCDNGCNEAQRRACMTNCDRALADCARAAGAHQGSALWWWMNDGRPSPGPNAPSCAARP